MLIKAIQSYIYFFNVKAIRRLFKRLRRNCLIASVFLLSEEGFAGQFACADNVSGGVMVGHERRGTAAPERGGAGSRICRDAERVPDINEKR